MRQIRFMSVGGGATGLLIGVVAGLGGDDPRAPVLLGTLLGFAGACYGAAVAWLLPATSPASADRVSQEADYGDRPPPPTP